MSTEAVRKAGRWRPPCDGGGRRCHSNSLVKCGCFSCHLLFRSEYRRHWVRAKTGGKGEGGDPRTPPALPARDGPWSAAGSRETHAADGRAWEVRQPRSTERRSRTKPGGGQRRDWREGGWPSGTRAQATTLRTQGRARVHAALGRVRQAAEQKKGVRFTALLHHIYAIDTLRAAFHDLKRDAAPGVDGETWEHYGQELEANLAELSERVRRGTYRPQPVRRVYIPKRGMPSSSDRSA